MSAEACLASFNRNNIFPYVCDIYRQDWHIQISEKNTKGFFQVPLATSGAYCDALLQICRKENISHIIPLTDVEIDAIDANRGLFDGITLCMPTHKVIETVRNKKKVFDKFRDDPHISVIPTCLWEDRALLHGDIIAKPVCGRSSENQYRLKDAEMLQRLTDDVSQYILQPFLQGDVFTVDIVRDSYGNVEFTIRRELVRTKNGAGVVVEMVEHPVIASAVRYLSHTIDVVGCVNFEFLVSDNIAFLLDINPRFSAGVGFSELAGYDMVQNHVRCFEHEQIKPCTEKTVLPHIYAKRYITLG